MTTEDKAIVEDFLADESLYRNYAGDYTDYYGVYQYLSQEEKDKMDKRIEPLMKVLRTKIPEITSFCSFVKNYKGITSVRYLCKYDDNPTFIGVGYISIDEILNGEEE